MVAPNIKYCVYVLLLIVYHQMPISQSLSGKNSQFLIFSGRFVIPLNKSISFDLDSSLKIHFVGIDLIYDCAVVFHGELKNGSCLNYFDIYSDSSYDVDS